MDPVDPAAGAVTGAVNGATGAVVEGAPKEKPPEFPKLKAIILQHRYHTAHSSDVTDSGSQFRYSECCQ